jgi:hypothetical protein
MCNKLLRRLVTSILEQWAVVAPQQVLPPGYNPLKMIRGGLFHWVAVPFNGVPVWCELRCMNATQIRACGDYSNIMAKEKTELSHEKLIALRNYQEQLIIGTLNRPTYNEIASLIGEQDFVVGAKRQELEELKSRVLHELSPVQQAAIQNRISDTELFLGYLLPEDTMGFLSAWASGNDVSDIKKVTDEQFLEAAILAENGHDNPTDHISGVFTDHNKQDMDRYAWNVYANYLKHKEVEKTTRSTTRSTAGTRRRTIGGPKGKRR